MSTDAGQLDGANHESPLRQRRPHTISDSNGEENAVLDASPSSPQPIAEAGLVELPIPAPLNQFVAGLWDSVFTPGTNPQLLLAMNLSFMALFLSLLLLLFGTQFNGHVMALLVITAALYGSVHWFLLELAKVREAEGEEKQHEATSDSADQPESSKITIEQSDNASTSTEATASEPSATTSDVTAPLLSDASAGAGTETEADTEEGWLPVERDEAMTPPPVMTAATAEHGQAPEATQPASV